MPMNAKEMEHFIEWYYPKLIDSSFELKNFNSKNYKEKINYKLKIFRKINYSATYQKIYGELELNKPNLEEIEYKTIKKAIEQQFLLSKGFKNGSSLASVVKDWGSMTLDAFYEKIGIKNLLIPPKIYYGPSRSEGHYDPKKHRIFIDPKKNDTKQKKLKTLEFEVENSTQQKDRLALSAGGGSAVDKAWKSIELEYKTSKKEINKLLIRHKLPPTHNEQNYSKLVDKIGISSEIKKSYKPRKYNKTTIKTKTGRVPMPHPTKLKEKDKRTALFWYQVGTWKDREIIEEYAYRPHTPGGISTLEQETKKFDKKIRKV